MWVGVRVSTLDSYFSNLSSSIIGMFLKDAECGVYLEQIVQVQISALPFTNHDDLGQEMPLLSEFPYLANDIMSIYGVVRNIKKLID